MTTDVFTSLPADVRAEAASLLDELRERGYEEREFFNELRPGARVRHTGHRYPEAYERGTGVVLHVTEKKPSSWSQTYGVTDAEMVVLWDEGVPLGHRMSLVAQYHVQHVAVES